MPQALLITRPEHDITTRYLSRWSIEIIRDAERRGIHVVDLHRAKAERQRVVVILEKDRAVFVILNGHGDAEVVRGHDDQVILRIGDRKALASKIIVARSCRSAKLLGQDALTSGAKAYLGYDEDFWFMYTESKLSRPLEDRTAALFLKPSNQLALLLLKGHTTAEANKRSKALFRRNIEKLLIAGPSASDYSAVKYLYWDMTHQVCLGNPAATFLGNTRSQHPSHGKSSV